MQRSIIICFCLLALAVSGQNRNAAPKVKDVVKKFYSQYTMDPLVDPNTEYPYVAFEKRQEGWYVVTQKLNKDNNHYSLEPVDKFLFYDNRFQKYKPLSFAKITHPKQVNPADYFDEYTLKNYDLHVYYGYRGWYKDVIKDLKDRKQLSEDEMNSLARAYSMYAGSLVSDQAIDALLNEVWQLPLNMNCLSPQQITRFNSLEAKAQEYFKKLENRNPQYETTVGKIGLKYANELMFQFTVLLAYANDYAMKMNLPDNLYSVEQLKAAQKNLEICPPNAILFSFGDNDYYPVHYLQHVKGIRRDVFLINYSLIGLDRYIYRATLPMYDAEGVKVSVDTSFYKGDNNDLIYIKDSSYTVQFDQVLQIIRSEIKSNGDIKTLAADHISITLSQKEAETTTTNLKITEGINAIIDVNKSRYLMKNNWILLDIINNLRGRKICFPNRFDGDQLQGLNNYLVNKDGLYIYDN